MQRIGMLVLVLIVLLCPTGQAAIETSIREDSFDGYISANTNSGQIALGRPFGSGDAILILTMGDFGKQGDKDIMGRPDLRVIIRVATPFETVRIRTVELKIDNDTHNIILREQKGAADADRERDELGFWLPDKRDRVRILSANRVDMRISSTAGQWTLQVPDEVLQEWQKVLSVIKRTPTPYNTAQEWIGG